MVVLSLYIPWYADATDAHESGSAQEDVESHPRCFSYVVPDTSLNEESWLSMPEVRIGGIDCAGELRSRAVGAT